MADIYDINEFIEKIIKKLTLDTSRKAQIKAFLETVSYYQLTPYIDFIKDNHDISKKLSKIIPDCKDKWDIVVELYRYNIKLSGAIYPFIHLFEITLKNKVNNYLCEKIGFDWFKDRQILYYLSKRSFTKEYVDIFEKYSMSAKKPNIMNLIEDIPLSFWIFLLEMPELWNGKQIKLKEIFYLSDLTEIEKREFYAKLHSVRKLRNDISHFNRIIGRYIFTRKIAENYYKKYKLYEIYSNILELFNLFGCKDVDSLIGDLHCKPTETCKGNSFKYLYLGLDFIHKYEIKPKN